MDTTATAQPDLTPVRRAMILVTVVMATTLYGTTLLVVSTILPQMQGSFAATADEIAWAMTFNILASTANFLKGHGWQRGGSWEPGSANYGVIRDWNRAEVYQRTISIMATKLRSGS